MRHAAVTYTSVTCTYNDLAGPQLMVHNTSIGKLCRRRQTRYSTSYGNVKLSCILKYLFAELNYS